MANATAAAKESDTSSDKVLMEDLVGLCKRRGFIFQASEIYDGINGFWDYGPLGTLLKNNIRDRWWQDMVLAPPIGPDGNPVQIVGVDSSIIQNPRVWKASGHVDTFTDPMVDCRETKLRYRADHLVVLTSDDKTPGIAIMENDEDKEIDKRLKKLKIKKEPSDFERVPLDPANLENVIGPDAKKPGSLTEPRAFNLMFKTYIGATATEDDVAYLRPETAQGIFLNYKNIVDNMRVRVPFGIAQIGKAFRNEVTPRNFIFRSREFEQMEMEWFCHPDDAKKWMEFWTDARMNWWKSIGVEDNNMQLRQHDSDELSHYAKEGEGTVDIEYKFPFTAPGFGELEGIAHRGNYDLTQHEEHSGKKMEYFDDINRERFIPHVIEPASGLTRAVLTLLAEAYTVDESRPSKMFMKFKPSMAPIKAAIMPLTNKDSLPDVAQKIYMDVRTKFMTDLDTKGNIGKRYARNDEIGTPFCITVDNQTLEDQAVTIRNRDTTQQERVSLDKVEEYVSAAVKI